MKKLTKLIRAGIVASALSVYSVSTIYAQEVQVFALDNSQIAYEEPVKAAIDRCIPEDTIEAFNWHNGQVVIDADLPAKYNIAGLTNGVPTSTGWYNWDNGTTYVTVTPAYGLKTTISTTLHEFGHVFDMQVGATNNKNVQSIIESEIPRYTSLEERTGYMIPSIDSSREFFAQIYSAVVADGTGLVPYSSDMILACPSTANYIKTLLSKE